jgi:hypothetical protein
MYLSSVVIIVYVFSNCCKGTDKSIKRQKYCRETTHRISFRLGNYRFLTWKILFSYEENIVFRPRKRTSAVLAPSQNIKESPFFFVQLFGSLDKRSYLCKLKTTANELRRILA